MIRAEPEPVAAEVFGTAVGVGNTRDPGTRREVMEWRSWIVAAEISILVPGLNCLLE
jgi:hypothetical protein